MVEIFILMFQGLFVTQRSLREKGKQQCELRRSNLKPKNTITQC